ncbi:hypothetical protein KRR40_35675 [Niabella defluvii]|nr:hypothetical protein KRR40_35675 [Niabella sp. I65]
MVKKASPDKVKKFSNELLVNKKTPPAFLVHAKDDGGVPFGNSIAYYEALQKNKVPAAIKLFEKGVTVLACIIKKKTETGWPSSGNGW